MLADFMTMAEYAAGGQLSYAYCGDARFNMQNLLAGGAVRSVRGEQVGFNPKDANMTTGPRPDPKATFSDPEGLKIK